MSEVVSLWAELRYSTFRLWEMLKCAKFGAWVALIPIGVRLSDAHTYLGTLDVPTAEGNGLVSEWI